MASNPSTEPAVLRPDKRSGGLEEIVVFIERHTKAGGILEFAGELAEEHGARLIGVFLQPEPTITPAETFARRYGHATRERGAPRPTREDRCRLLKVYTHS